MRALTVALFFLSLTSIAQTTCLDPLACNFTEIGDCVYLDIDGLPCVSEGCAIPGACNFDPEADINDGSCEFTSCLGCTDETACNYEPEALYLDLSCIYFVDCNGVCGGDWIEDECGNCFQSYSESIYTFETCGAEGRFGPSQEQCDQVYGSEFVTCVEGIQTWVVPESGTYRIEVFGAEGGYNDRFCGADIFNTLDRALGARINANIDLEAGQIVWIVIGQQGVTADADGCNGGSGGGGGSFVFTEYDLLLVAGGGGGSGLRNQYSQQTQSGKPGVTSNNGTSSWSGAAGGTVGYNGAGDGGSGGQGWNTLSYTYIFDGFFVDNSYHGHGGFGGGGGGYVHHGAGGGGYSGGGGSNFTYAGGGGGGSYISEDGTLISAESGVNEGHGMVVIEFSSPSDPECQLGCIVEQACNFNPEATNDDGTCDFCFCGPGTAWDNLSEQCLIVEGSSDIDGDGCTNLSDLLDLLADYGICDE